ncbi:MAG: hypothetical protein WCL18_00295 [bacterium]
MSGVAKVSTVNKNPVIYVNFNTMKQTYNLTDEEVLFILFHEVIHLQEEAEAKSDIQGYTNYSEHKIQKFESL